MEKKKLKLSISGSSKKTINSIEQAKTQSKNTVVIERKSTRFSNRNNFPKLNIKNEKFKSGSLSSTRNNSFSKPLPTTSSNFEKRKLAEQRATRRIKGEVVIKENKSGKTSGKRRELKLTISRALSDEDIETKSRSLASLKRAKLKENRVLNKKNIEKS